MPRGKPKGLSCKEETLDPQQVTQLPLVCPTLRDRFIVYSLLYAGFRVSRLKHLKRSWVNLNEGTITIPIRQYFVQLDSNSEIRDGEVAELIPQLLDRLVVLGDLARQISHALVGI